jgi:hypothetical protein
MDVLNQLFMIPHAYVTNDEFFLFGAQILVLLNG